MFFFKQKTAYEMRISDWSSDVCASDLAPACKAGWAGVAASWCSLPWQSAHSSAPIAYFNVARQAANPGDRSEEHTSELQSLMRISYAVFCLQKKHEQIRIARNHHQHQKTHRQSTSIIRR